MDTNIVLLSLRLVLPAFNQFAERAQLDMELPLNLTNATKTHISRFGDSAMATFEGRHQFNWNSQTSNSYSGSIIMYIDKKNATETMDRVKLLPWLVTQKSLITTNEAREIAEQCLHRLGYDRSDLIKFPPHVGQFNYLPIENKPLPLFYVVWYPKKPGRAMQEVPDNHAFLMEISGLTKRITCFLLNREFISEPMIDLRTFMTNSIQTVTNEQTAGTNIGRASAR